ncbi:MAG: hypothetical protein V3575_06245 [Candidatus Absconditabacteria bacterium]
MNEFNTFNNYLNTLKDNYFLSLSMFKTWQGLNEMLTIEEDKHLILNRYKNFYQITQMSLLYSSLGILSKIFDNCKDSITIYKIINYLTSNHNKLDISKFQEANKERIFLEELLERYEGINIDDINEINENLKKEDKSIKKLKYIRDKFVAHHDINFDTWSISQSEIITLFALVEKILNTLSYKTDFSVNNYDHVEDYKNEFKEIVDYLYDYEKYRIKKNI